jgi:hypothetical protein
MRRDASPGISKPVFHKMTALSRSNGGTSNTIPTDSRLSIRRKGFRGGGIRIRLGRRSRRTPWDGPFDGGRRGGPMPGGTRKSKRPPSSIFCPGRYRVRSPVGISPTAIPPRPNPVFLTTNSVGGRRRTRSKIPSTRAGGPKPIGRASPIPRRANWRGLSKPIRFPKAAPRWSA